MRPKNLYKKYISHLKNGKVHLKLEYFIIFQRLVESCKPSSDWGPNEPEIRERWISFQNQHSPPTNSIELKK